MDIEIIDCKELGKRLRIETKNIKKAIELEQLQPGVHFIDIGGSGPRFEWSEELIKKLHDCCKKCPDARPPKVRARQCRINLGSLGLPEQD
ncbi:hypothetical protein M1B72_07155 [Geomonas paludis]|uniref:Uncharacterized protein n=1 Tax=Geomonas paludis TaxID=2740185 RepID=A0ABY4LHK3_9BACT|nr:hypothetical protein [Geomonas paludis]UPU37475.1 hypothetical protein M1B72_07155 [Geomonas paludis]